MADLCTGRCQDDGPIGGPLPVAEKRDYESAFCGVSTRISKGAGSVLLYLSCIIKVLIYLIRLFLLDKESEENTYRYHIQRFLMFCYNR